MLVSYFLVRVMGLFLPLVRQLEESEAKPSDIDPKTDPRTLKYREMPVAGFRLTMYLSIQDRGKPDG